MCVPARRFPAKRCRPPLPCALEVKASSRLKASLSRCAAVRRWSDKEGGGHSKPEKVGGKGREEGHTIMVRRPEGEG